jgi:DNA-binding NtrC family response regulator
MGDRNYKILVVDDDLEMCALLSGVLKGEGFTVMVLSDSLEASEALKREEFDAIVTDLKMKGLKGLDLLEEANKRAPLTPVIIKICPNPSIGKPMKNYLKRPLKRS